MKKFVVMIMAGILSFSLASCGESSTNTSGESSGANETTTTVTEPLSKDELDKMYSSPKGYKGSYVEVIGRVFNEPEYDEKGVYFQMWADPENYEKNTIVAYYDPDAKIKDDDYVRVCGTVRGEFSGENAFGGTVSAPQIEASELEVLSYQEALAPTIYLAQAQEPTIDQIGYSVTVEKVELAEKETRVYVTVKNNGSDKFSLYNWNATVIQNGKQYEHQSNWEADYPEIQSDLRVGVTSEGIICFPPLEPEEFELILEGSSDNWNERLNEYVYTIEMI